MAKTYKIRRFQNGKNKAGDPFLNYSLTIPSHIAEALPDEMQFACELTEDGIVFRPATPEDAQVQLPSWAQANGNGEQPAAEAPTPAKKPSGSRKRPSRAKAESAEPATA